MIKETVNYTIFDFRIKTRSASNYTMSTHHFHDAYEIYYLNAGTRGYFLNDTTYTVNPGELVLIKPHDLHKTIDTGVCHSRVLISFKPAFLPLRNMAPIIETCFSESRVITFDASLREEIEEILRNMIVIADSADAYHLTELQCQLTQLLIKTAKYLNSTEKKTDTILPSNQKAYEITQYLKTNYNKAITLDGLAEEFYLSRYHLTRVFKKNTGFTIFEYLHSVRVVEAQRLLRESSKKIIEISEAVGFTNVSNFGKVFKSITGQSPSNYRKHNTMDDKA